MFISEKKRAGQSSLEYILLIGTILVILTPIIYYASSQATSNIRLNQASDVVNTLSSAADTVYSIGPGTKKYVQITIPGGVESTSVGGKEILLKLQIFRGTSDITSSTKAYVVGSFPKKEGTYWIPVEALESGLVRIGEYDDKEPPVVTETSPSGEIIGTAGDNYVILEAYTNEPSTCKYCQSTACDENTIYDSMGFTFDGLSFYHKSGVTLPGLGVYKFYVRCKDPSGNVMATSALLNFTIVEAGAGEGIGEKEEEENPPNVTLARPEHTKIVNYTRIVFEYNASDASTVIACKLILNGIAVQSSTEINKSVTQNFTRSLERGNYTWQVNCTDSHGNEGSSSRWNLTVNATLDTDKPVVTLESPADGALRNFNLVRFNYNVTDITSGIAYCTLIISGVLDAGGTVDQMVTDTSVFENETQALMLTLEKGNYTWQVNCTDNSNERNVGGSAKWIIRVNSTQEESFVSSCAGWCGYNGFSNGVCENAVSKCANTCGLPYSPTHSCYSGSQVSEEYCLGGSEADTCCCIP